MVSARRSFAGTLPLAMMRRLVALLAEPAGEARYDAEFGRDELGQAYLDVTVEAPLTLTCQRTLEPFVLPVSLHSRLGLLSDERQEAALPPGCEPLLVDEGRVDLAAVIEDELLLAVPLVPVSPQSELPALARDPRAGEESEAPVDNPFAVLRELKKQ
jgi:uncharacterized protein